MFTGGLFPANSQIFWFGDLNYRINMLDVEVRKLVALNKWDELMNNDQVGVGLMKPQLCTICVVFSCHLVFF